MFRILDNKIMAVLVCTMLFTGAFAARQAQSSPAVKCSFIVNGCATYACRNGQACTAPPNSKYLSGEGRINSDGSNTCGTLWSSIIGNCNVSVGFGCGGYVPGLLDLSC